jgi:hypothetical protein
MEAHCVLCEVGTEALIKCRLLLLVSPVSFIPPMPHTHLYLNTTVIRRTSGRNLRNFKVTIFQKENKFFSVFKTLKHIGLRTYKNTFSKRKLLLYAKTMT